MVGPTAIPVSLCTLYDGNSAYGMHFCVLTLWNCALVYVYSACVSVYSSASLSNDRVSERDYRTRVEQVGIPGQMPRPVPIIPSWLCREEYVPYTIIHRND